MINTINAHKYCQQKTRTSGTSFYYSFLFLPIKKRQAIMAIYAFCREIDDIVDEYNDRIIAQKKLAWWQEEINRTFTNKPQHPIGIALKDILTTFKLPQSLFIEIISGMAMDLNFQPYNTFAELQKYCYLAASTVGLLVAEIFGYQDPQTLVYARKLGIAMQLVNIIRDVGEDAQRKRIYLPQEELTQFGITVEEILTLNIKTPAKFYALMDFQATRAKNIYQDALKALPVIDRHKQRRGLIMAKIYFSILDKIIASQFKVLNNRISINPLHKVWLAWQTINAEKKYCKTLVNAS